MKNVGKKCRGKLVKVLYNFPDGGHGALIYDVDSKLMKFGGALKYEIFLRGLMKEYFKAKNIKLSSDREIKYRRRLVGESGQVRYEWRTRRNGRIVYRFKCPGWLFTMGYRKMVECRSLNMLNFSEVESIGRILN